MKRTLFILICFLGFCDFLAQTPQPRKVDSGTFFTGVGVSILSSELTYQIKEKTGLSCFAGLGTGFLYSGFRRISDKNFDYITSGWGNIIGTVTIACAIDFRKRRNKEIKDAYDANR